MFGFEGPFMRPRHARIDDALVRAQILRRPRRRPAVQIGRRRNQMALHRAEPAGNERARLQVSDPQRELDAFLHQIDEALAEADIDPHFRIIPDIVGDDRDHVAPPERGGDADPERARRARRRFLDARPRHIEGADDLAREIVDAVRLGRGFELARRAQEQLRAEFAFQQRDALADRRLADAEFLRGSREAAALQGAHEGAQAINSVHEIFQIGNKSYPIYSVVCKPAGR